MPEIGIAINYRVHLLSNFLLGTYKFQKRFCLNASRKVSMFYKDFFMVY